MNTWLVGFAVEISGVEMMVHHMISATGLAQAESGAIQMGRTWWDSLLREDDRHRWQYPDGVVWFNSIILLDDVERGGNSRKETDMTQTTTRALSADVQTHGNACDIIPSVPVERIVAQRNRGVTAFLEGVALIREAQTTLAEASGRSWFAGLSQIVESSLCSDRSEQRNAAIRRRICRIADRDIWTRLMNETGMLTLMSEAQRKQWDTQLYSDDCPEITPDNVIATFRALNASKGATFELGVIDVFRNLSWDYKTNTPCLLGKRIIIDGVLDNHRGLYFSVRTYAQSRINDLARPFWILDGKNVPDFRVSEGARLSEFISRGGANSVGDVFTCEYFTVRAYKKGSAHITFTRPDLVEKVNDIIARHYPGALPPKA